MRITVVCLLTLVTVSVYAGGDRVRTRHVDARLVSEIGKITPNHSFWVGLHLKIRPGWHTYWLNPGDSGLATSIEWQLPEGMVAGAIRWPIPRRFSVGHLMNYGYADEVVLLTRMSAWPAIAAGQEVALAADVQWLVCEDICIMEGGRFEVSLPVSVQAPVYVPEHRALIGEYARQLPAAPVERARFSTTPEVIRLRVSLPSAWPREAEDIWFYPQEFGVVDHAAPQQARSSSTGIELTLVRGDLKHQVLKRLLGVLVLRYGRYGERGLSVDAQPG